MASRVSKKITKDDPLYDRLINLKLEEITSTFIFDLFGEYNGSSKCNPYDIIEIPPGYYGPEDKKNKNKFVTTVGLWVYNKWMIEPGLFDLFGYINKPVTGKVMGNMNQELSFALMEDRISVQALKDYLMKTQLVMQYVIILSPNYSESLLTITKTIEPLKNRLIKEHRKELEVGDTLVADNIEKELIKYALDKLGDDPAMDIILSDSRTSMNNFKNLFIWKGITRDPDPNARNEYRVATSNYMEGIKPEEYSLYSNSGIEGAYSRGKKTEDGGYLENLATRAYQDIILDEPGTDCGTTRCIEVVLDKSNYVKYIYNNIIGRNGKLIELTSQNAPEFFGKKVKMRMAYLCKHEKPCAACAGNFFYRLGKRNVGLMEMQVFSIFKNKSMKAFHDSTVGLTEIDCMKAFGLRK